MDKPIEALEQLIQICHASAAVSTRAVLPYLEAHYDNTLQPAPQPARDVAGLLAEAEAMGAWTLSDTNLYPGAVLMMVQDLATALRDAEGENEEWQRSFEIYHACQMRAVKLWQEKHPDKPLTWPDGAEGICTVFEEVDQLRADLDRERAARVKAEGERDALREEGDYLRSAKDRVTRAMDEARAQLDAVTRERDEALNHANKVERAELRLREEVTDALNRVGLAAGPRAIQSLVEQRDAALARAEAAEARLNATTYNFPPGAIEMLVARDKEATHD